MRYCTILLILWVSASPALAEVDEDLLILVEAVVGGTASVKRVGEDRFLPLQSEDLITEGDVLLAGDGAGVDLRLSDGSTIRLASGARLTVQRVAKNDVGWTTWVFELLDGVVRGQVRESDGKSSTALKLKISTPIAQMGVRGTAFTFGIDGDASILETYSGEVLLGGKESNLETAKEGVERVISGQISSFSRGQARPAKPVPSAQGRRENYKKSVQFFERSRALAERPILLKARFQELRTNERQRLRENFQRARPGFVPNNRKQGGAGKSLWEGPDGARGGRFRTQDGAMSPPAQKKGGLPGSQLERASMAPQSQGRGGAQGSPMQGLQMQRAPMAPQGSPMAPQLQNRGGSPMPPR